MRLAPLLRLVSFLSWSLAAACCWRVGVRVRRVGLDLCSQYCYDCFILDFCSAATISTTIAGVSVCRSIVPTNVAATTLRWCCESDEVHTTHTLAAGVKSEDVLSLAFVVSC